MTTVAPLLTDEEYGRLEKRIRILLADFPELNQLTGEETFSRDRIEIAVEDALDDWNASPPPLANVSFGDHPHKSLLSRRIMIELLRHEHLTMTRNGVEFSDGGASISDATKANALLNLIASINNEYQQQKESKKVAINIRGGWGGVPGDYGYR